MDNLQEELILICFLQLTLVSRLKDEGSQGDDSEGFMVNSKNYLLLKTFKMQLKICLSIAQAKFWPDILSVNVY
jgi:hypothetical protein